MIISTNKQINTTLRQLKAEAKATGRTVNELAADMMKTKAAKDAVKNYLTACGVKPASNGEQMLKQFAACRINRARAYAQDNFTDMSKAMEADEFCHYLGDHIAPATIAANYCGPNNADGEQPSAGDILQAAGGIANIIGTLTSILQGAFTKRWTGEQKDFIKLYMSITGRTKFDNSATVGANGQAAGGDPIEYTQQGPEAAVYFTLKYGKPVTDRTSALAAIGETWTNGLWDRIYARDAATWRDVFTRNGLPVPITPYVFGGAGNDYTQTLTQLNSGTFKPAAPAITGGAGGILSGIFSAGDQQAGTGSAAAASTGMSTATIVIIAAALILLLIVMRRK